MLRSYNAGPLVRGLLRNPQTHSAHLTVRSSSAIIPQIRTLGTKRPLALTITSFRPVSSTLQCYATKSALPYDKINPTAERKTLEKALEADPEHVSADSAVGSHVFEHAQAQKDKENDDADMLAGIRGDLVSSV